MGPLQVQGPKESAPPAAKGGGPLQERPPFKWISERNQQKKRAHKVQIEVPPPPAAGGSGSAPTLPFGGGGG